MPAGIWIALALSVVYFVFERSTMNLLRPLAIVLAAIHLTVLPLAHAHEGKNAAHDHQHDKHIQADIERHKAMAAVHHEAAQCLASGKDHAICQKELQQACKGLAIGKHCGMRHIH